MLWGDPFPFIADGDTRLTIGRGCYRDPDPTACWGMPDRVIEQDHHELVKGECDCGFAALLTAQGAGQPQGEGNK